MFNCYVCYLDGVRWAICRNESGASLMCHAMAMESGLPTRYEGAYIPNVGL